MKKIFTLICALMGFAGSANAATEDDIAVTKHSYVLVCDDVTNNGTVKPAKGTLVGDNHFLLAGSDANKSVSSGKGSVDLSVADGEIVTEEIAAKYGEFGSHLNSLRLKNKQDMFVVKLTAGSKMIIFYNGQGKSGASARMPRVATDADLEKTLNDAPTAETGKVGTARLEVNIPDDGTYYVGSYNSDIFFSYVIIEAKEAPGTPTVKVGKQTYENGLWFKEVTCKANPMVEEGSSESIPTVVYYTTDGTTPTTASTKYTEPIKCYKDMTVKFQAYMDLGIGEISEEDICPNADNEGNVNFSFDAPTIKAEGATFTITSDYAEQNGTNFYTLNGGDEIEGNGTTLEIGKSAVVCAYTKIKNGDVTFTSKSATSDVYAINPIKAEQKITVSGTAVEDPEAETQPAYKTEDGAVNADNNFFFTRNIEYGVLANADANKAKYQAPEGQEVYLKMNGNTISFLVAAGDSVDVVVTCSKNSCKNIDEPEEEVKKEGSKVADNRKCFINVNGTNYGGVDLVDNPTGNVVKFGLKGSKTVSQNKKDADGNDVLDENGKVVKENVSVDTDMIYTFQKYSGTGNILVSSIEITPVSAEPKVETVDITPKFTNKWNGAETLTNNEDGSITYKSAAWGGMAAWMKDGDNFADWSTYSKVVFEFAEATTCNTQILVQGTDAKAWGEVGITKLECPFDGIDVTKVEQCALQTSEAVTLTVKKVYLVKKSETGVNVIKAVNVQNGVRYNMAGQKVDESYKGIVIMNGKKFVVK